MNSGIKCRLCRESDELVHSHIIPECFYENLYDAKHRILPISTEVSQLSFQQKGFREELFCTDCEKRLGNWETILKKDLVDIGKEQSRFLHITKRPLNILEVKGIRYGAFKRGILSIIWRLGIGNCNFCKGYKLGIYEEKLREILYSNEEIPESNYPVMISKCKIGHQYRPGLLMGFPVSNIDNKHKIQKVLIWGFLITVIVNDHSSPKDKEELFLKEDGSIFITEIQYSELDGPGSVTRRFLDTDVKNMFSRMRNG